MTPDVTAAWLTGFAKTLAIGVGAFATLTVFSYLARDNKVYRLVQNAALGVAVGIALVLTWQQVLEPRWWARIHDGFTGGATGKVPWTQALWLLALVPGSLWYFQLSKKHFWVSTLVSGLFVGAAAGLAFQGQMLLVLPQVKASLKIVNPWAAGALTWASFFQSLNSLIFFVGLFTSLMYFFFSVRTDNVLLRPPMRVGRVTIMIALGAMFGCTVMTRMAYLLDRIQFLQRDWLIPISEQLRSLFGG